MSGGPQSAQDLRLLLTENLAVLERVCRGLETVADELPEHVDIARCNEIAASLYVTVKSAHDFEENKLFPRLLEQSDHAEQLAGILERLRFEHWEDQSYANEVQEALLSFAKAPQRHNTESLSWMLRGFFESVRRHLAFERDYVLPLIGK